MNRKIDYFVAPLPIILSFIAFYVAFQTSIPWVNVYAISGIGGALATVIYGYYLVDAYTKVAQQYGVDY